MRLRFHLNGSEHDVDVETDALLLDVVRDLGFTGSKEGCAVGVCGACTMVLDGLPVSSCITFAGLVEGLDVLTVEGVTASDPLLVDAFIEHEGMQCGICTPGQVVSAYTLKREHPNATEDEVRTYMAGNLCRCTGYVSITNAVTAYLASA